jgi:hypothetical protein
MWVQPLHFVVNSAQEILCAEDQKFAFIPQPLLSHTSKKSWFKWQNSYANHPAICQAKVNFFRETEG